MKMRWSLKILLITHLFLALYNTGAANDPAKSFYFSNLKNTDRLISNSVFAITADNQGFIWIGSINGLFRYDGYELVEVKYDGESIRTSGIIPDNKGGLWVSGSNLQYLNTHTFECTTFLEITEDDDIRTIYEHKEDVWIGTEKGLIQINKQTHALNTFTKQNSGLSNNIVRAVYKDTNGGLWVGTADKLNYMEIGSSTFETIDLKGNYNPDIIYNHILTIKPASENNDSLLLIGSETGLSLFNTITKKGQLFNVNNSELSNDVIKCIHRTENGKLWLGTDFGLNLFTIESGKCDVFFHQPDQRISIADNVIWSIFEDDAGVIWFGTSNGISWINSNKTNFKYLPVRKNVPNGIKIGDVVNAIEPADKQNIWIATNHGISLYNYKDGAATTDNVLHEDLRQLQSDKIQSLYTDSLNRLWIGSVGGFYIWDDEKEYLHKITSENKNVRSLKSNYINKFVLAPDSSFFISLWQRGIYKVLGDFQVPENLNFDLTLDFNTNLVANGNKYLWIMEQNQLFRFNPANNSIDTINLINNRIKNNYISTIYFSSKGKLWLGSQNVLYEYSPNDNQVDLHKFESKQEVAILSIEEDLFGNLWMSSYKSIYRLDVTTKEIRAFVLGNEQPLNGFTPWCSAKLDDGNLMFGGNDGMIIFNPSEIDSSQYTPKIVFTGLKIYDRNIWAGDEITEGNHLSKNITYLDEIELPYKCRSFSISFSSLHFGAPEKNVYSYRLEGFDSNWNTLTKINSVSYSNIPPGKYVLKVRGTNNEGIWQQQEAIIAIRILPPLWLTWYFITAILLLAIGIIITILYFIQQKRKLAHEVLLEQAEKRNLTKLNQAKLQFFTNISHEFRTPLTLIAGPAKKLSKLNILNNESREMVSLISKNSDRMLRLVNQLMDFRKISSNLSVAVKTENDLIPLVHETFNLFIANAKEKHLHYIFHSNYKKVIFEFDKSKIETVLFNLLSNAFRYTQKGKVKISLNCDEDNEEVELIVSDTGIGISNEKLVNIFNRFYRANEECETGTGIGLNLAKEFIGLHQGKINVESTLGKGSRFIVTLPLSNSSHKIEIGQTEKEIVYELSEKKISKPLNLSNNDNEQKTLLVVEDNYEMAGFISGCLSNRYKVFIEKNGVNGVEKAFELMPDLIISDIMMPIKSGMELCAELKSNIKTSHIPIILLTALDTIENKKDGYYTGADDYIVKPFEQELLVARVAGLLKNRELLRQNFQLDKGINPKKLPISSPDQEFLKKIMQIIEDNIHEREINTELLTSELGMSRSVVYKKLKALTGQSIIEFTRDFRLKRAAALISEHGYSVTDACYKVGFSDRRYFTKIFKHRFGKSPSEYK